TISHFLYQSLKITKCAFQGLDPYLQTLHIFREPGNSLSHEIRGSQPYRTSRGREHATKNPLIPEFLKFF
ncbi:MAG: hypothetical protein ACRCWJ_15520, partial [Casimicrobium sp.]